MRGFSRVKYLINESKLIITDRIIYYDKEAIVKIYCEVNKNGIKTTRYVIYNRIEDSTEHRSRSQLIEVRKKHYYFVHNIPRPEQKRKSPREPISKELLDWESIYESGGDILDFLMDGGDYNRMVMEIIYNVTDDVTMIVNVENAIYKKLNRYLIDSLF